MQPKTKITILTAVALLACGFFALAYTPVFAQVSLDFPSNFAGFSSQDLKKTIENIVRIVLGFIGIVFLLLILYAGFLWMTSGGSEDKISRAKKIIAASVIGLLITLSSYAIARFIIDSFVRGTSDSGSSGGPPGGPGGFGYALGGGILESHYPGRNAKDVPRNTNIFVTFKEEIDPDTFCDVGAGTVRITSVQIVDIANGVEPDPNDTDPDDNTLDTVTCSTTDNFTFKLDPSALLGTSVDSVQYRVTLTSQIEKLADGDAAFDLNGYIWNFWVSNVTDETPPTVESVFPPSSPPAYDRNVVVQLNFSESVDPTTVSGIFPPFDSIELRTPPLPDPGSAVLDGSYISSNQYKTTEFYANEQCGVNSCGTPVYCLPGTVTIQGLAKGSGAKPITDMAGNILDGDADGIAGGDYTWLFDTTNDMDFTPPFIVNRDPVDDPASLIDDVDIFNPMLVDFSERMSASTIISNNIGLGKNGFQGEIGFWLSKEEIDVNPDLVDEVIGTRVYTHHEPFQPNMVYHPGAHSDLKDSYQNCFYPAAGQCIPLYGGQC